MEGIFLVVVLAVIILIVVTSCVKVVPQAKAYVVERLGAYQATWSTGLHFKVPIIERLAQTVK